MVEARRWAGIVKAEWRTRRERPWLGLVGVPLAMVAAGLIGMWWTWPVLLIDAWGYMPSWRWAWLLTLEEGFVGMQWASVGGILLAEFAGAQLLVGAIWVAFPVSLATAGIVSRRRRNRPEAYFPLR
jgi:hypothetical protein